MGQARIEKLKTKIRLVFSWFNVKKPEKEKTKIESARITLVVFINQREKKFRFRKFLTNLVALNKKICSVISIVYMVESALYFVFFLLQFSISKIFSALSQIALSIGFRFFVYTYLNKAYKRFDLQTQLILIAIANYIIFGAILVCMILIGYQLNLSCLQVVPSTLFFIFF